MAAVTSPARHAALLATSASNREQRQSKAHRAMEWPKPSSARSSVTMSASVRVRMQRPSCTSYQLGSIVHPVSSSQLTEARDRVRSFGGYNTRPVATLEDLQARALITGLAPAGGAKIVHVEWFGDQAVKVTYEDSSGAQFVYRNEKATLEIVEAGRPWSFGGDGALLIVGNLGAGPYQACTTIRARAPHRGGSAIDLSATDA